MKKKLLLILASVSTLTVMKSQNIAAARLAPIGSMVTVRGIVTNGSELGTIRYMQDNSAGITIFGSGVAPILLGDSIVAVGTATLYNNLLEITPITGFTVIASKPVPAPNLITPTGLTESVEGTLVRINNGTFSATGSFAGNTNYVLTVGAQTVQIRIDVANTNIVGTAIPTGPIDIIGVVGQFCNSPLTGCTVGYQIHPRTLADIILLPTGINEKRNNLSSLLIYPNPTSDIINIKNNSTQLITSVIISDAQGKIVYSNKNSVNTVDVKAFSNGIYNMTISTDKEIYNHKFIVQ